MKVCTFHPWALALILALPSTLPLPAGPAEDKLEEFYRAYLESAFKMRPLEATRLGDHRFDHLLEDLNPKARSAWVELARQTLKALPAQVNYEELTRSAQVDYRILEHELKTFIWLNENTHPFKEDPRVYNDYINDGVYLPLAQSTLPLETNVANAISRMGQIPKIIAAARENLRQPPRVHTETALRQNRGAIGFFEKDIIEYAKGTRQLEALKSAAKATVQALKQYQVFLEKELLPRAQGEWRLGKEKFSQKLALTLDAGITADQVLEDAEREFARVQTEMYIIARQLWSPYYPGLALPPDDERGRVLTVQRVLEAVSFDHGQPEDLTQEVRKTVSEIKDFIAANNILRLPEPDRCQIIEMPEFQRGNSTAYMNSPPPLDPNAAGYYAVSPPPRDWDEARVKSYLQEYNRHMLHILTIHEAYPGHYVQFEYANKSPSLIRKVLGSGVYVEGWAVYTEQMMLDQGYRRGDLPLRLTQLKFYLRAVVNALLDYRMHCTEMSDAQAMELLVNQAYQSEGEARLKVIRAKQSSCQLSTYFVGRMAHYRLRQSIQRELGPQFELGRYHEAVLGLGPVPVKFLPELVRAAVREKKSVSTSDFPNAARGEFLRQLVRNKVVKTEIQPHWLESGQRFWYRNDLGDGKREFVLVDAAEGWRRAAFDHARLAAALSGSLTCTAERLPIDSIASLDDGSMVFRAEGKTWQCDLNTYALSPQSPTSRQEANSAGRLKEPAPSRMTGAETSILFDNQTRRTVDLFWIDAEGNQRGYGEVAAGQKRSQHTFAGHVWLIKDGDETVAVYQATQEPLQVVIHPADLKPSSRPRRAGRGRSPDGKWLAFCKEHNLYLRNEASGQEQALTADGSAEDEYKPMFFWAPDSTKLVAMRIRQGDDRKVYYVESSPKDQLQPKLHSYNYLKPGDKIPHPRPQLFDIAYGRQIPISEELFPNPWSITETRWSPDARRFTFLYNERGHQRLRVIAVEAETGAARILVEERSDTFIDYNSKQYLNFLDATQELIWMSERDGWNHLYLFDSETGQLKNQITRGEWVVRGVESVDATNRHIYFRAGGIRPGQDPYYLHYARVNLDGSGLTVLTEGNGSHTIRFSPDRRHFIDKWSRVDLPPVHELRCSDTGRKICDLEKSDWSELLQTGWRPPQPFTAKGRDGQTDIYGVIIRPSHFDPKERYPVLEHIYAGPHGSFVPKNFQEYSSMQAMAELGFIVVSIDGMGTSNRSKKFHDVSHKNLGDSGFPDRIAWMKAAAARYACLDLSRVGIYGGSAGGQSALRALLAHGDFYQVAVADCGCHDNRMDKIWWNELWMGWPLGPHYEEQSNVTQAHHLEGNLMLIVGEMDENVDPASTMQVVNALVKARKRFDLVIIPGHGHGAAETEYGRARRAEFLVRNLIESHSRGL